MEQYCVGGSHVAVHVLYVSNNCPIFGKCYEPVFAGHFDSVAVDKECQVEKFYKKLICCSVHDCFTLWI